MLKACSATFLIALSATASYAQSNTNVLKVTSPVQELSSTQLGTAPSEKAQPYASGVLTKVDAVMLLKNLNADPSRTTIINILRWKDATHTSTKFATWYLYDPNPSKTSFYFESADQLLKSTAIAGQTELQFIYVHINADLTTGQSEYADPTRKSPDVVLLHNVSYSITVAKQQTQFLQDLQTLVSVLGFSIPTPEAGVTPALPPSPGYFSVTQFKSPWSTSSIAITASLENSNSSDPVNTKQTQSKTSGSTSNQLMSQTYTNEKPSWIGLSAGVQITSYKDVSYQQSSSTITPNSITQQNVYVFFDGYLPPVLPTLSSFRYIPQPFVGLPIKGKVLRHIMVGGGIGLHWLEPFGGVVFDTQNGQTTTTSGTSNKLTLQAVFGLKVSMTALGKALKKS
ncbi:hypothetical protein [Granulicella sp. S156]|uniref:hypothetical protein n=1 Tax=Granulicella sp. S156 TaxID=1747224 RepID=UPI00131BD7B7|nr:hypothetical protein [Granulicella sp. S156]